MHVMVGSSLDREAEYRMPRLCIHVELVRWQGGLVLGCKSDASFWSWASTQLPILDHDLIPTTGTIHAMRDIVSWPTKHLRSQDSTRH